MTDTPTPVPAASERMTMLRNFAAGDEPVAPRWLKEALALVDKQAAELARWEFNSRANMQYAAQNLTDRILKLQAFKDYVHLRLDEAGIPKEPGGEHSKAGCRVGDRLDIALTLSAQAEAADARAETARATALEEAAEWADAWANESNAAVAIAKAIRALLTAPPPTANDRTDG